MDLNTIERNDADIAAESKVMASAPAKKVFVKTYGCQMNVYDSQRMTDALAADGYTATDAIAEADLVLLNTCHIREKAAEKVYSELGRIRDMKAERAIAGRELLIGVAGCVAQAEGAEIIRRSPAVDLVIGPQTYHRLPDVLARVRGGEKIVETEYAGQVRALAAAEARRSDQARRHRLPHGAGRLRQVLHLLRRALYQGLGSFAAGGADRRRSRAPGRRRRA